MVGKRKSPKAAGPERGTSPQPSRAGKKQVTVWVPEDTKRRLKLASAVARRTVEDLLKGAIEDVLKKHRV
jgi:hypothetical protein